MTRLIRQQCMRYRLTPFVVLAWLVYGCTPTVTSYRVDPDGRITRLETVGADEHWKQLVAERIGKEMRGEPAEAGHSTWATYWQWWYANLRRQPKPAWRSSEFKTSEDMVTYIKEQRASK